MPRVLLIALLVAFPCRIEAAPTVSFNRDVRSILSDHCFTCHGPDENKRKAKLRLDEKAPAQAARKDILARITSSDPDEHMPPKSGRPLSVAQVDVLKRWVEAGAPWEEHWAFVPPKMPNDSPSIDSLVQMKLRSVGLKSSPSADRITLIRRVTLDLTGLPPTPAEVDAFVNDRSPDAYEKVVDRLLASTRFGERMAWRWLEAARYADTSGYQSDGDRDMWRWRDWVIDAINANMPFDQFTIEQLAGDLLPNATLEQKIATGFNRNHRGNGEGGIIPEEYAVEYVVDRVDTTSTVWLGLTVGCARCHDHKYDPVSQREFYQMFAFFNNVPEKGRAVKLGNSPPMIQAPTLAQIRERERLKQALTIDPEMLHRMSREQREWEPTVPTNYEFQSTRKLQTQLTIDRPLPVEESKAGDFGFMDRFTLSCWIQPETPNGPILTRMIDEPQGEGYGVMLVDGKVRVVMTKRWLDDAMRVESRRSIEPGKKHHLAVAYDGSRSANGVRIYIDGVAQEQTVLLDELNQTFANTQPFRVGAGGGSRFRGTIRDVRIYNDRLLDGVISALSAPETVGIIARIPSEQRTFPQRQKLDLAYTEQGASAPIREWLQQLDRTNEQLRKLEDTIPTVMVMEEMTPPRPAHILIRGQYDRPGERVERGIPKSFSAWPKDAPTNRLGFAKWLVDPSHPLTARVAVNRAWQMHFGTGIVKSTEDFGVQGEAPSHPELLDFLAVKFVQSGWNVKALHRMIVMSDTYRQSSQTTAEQLTRDPENRLLSRGPRYRLAAEMIRDQALFASGLFVERVGGPSVKPYQPAGLWIELTGGKDYVADTGENLYRRSLYTYWKRTIAPPNMLAFDAAGREACVVRESRTNTPLQALALMNDVAFIEASRGLAQRAMQNAATIDERIRQMFRLLISRPPTEPELIVLREAFTRQLEIFRNQPDAGRKLIHMGESIPDTTLDGSELAAFTMVANLIMNLDEAMTKE